MRIECLHYLIELSKYQSMNKAAEELYISQSTLSAAIRSLEDELGVALVQTTRHGTQMTAFGQRVVDDSKVIMGLVDAWKADSQTSHDLKEDIAIGISQIASYIIFQNNILDFKKTYPNISLRLLRQRSADIFQMLKYGKCNLGIILALSDDIPAIANELRSIGLKIELVYEDELEVCMNENSLLADHATISVSDLSSLCYCGYSQIEMFPNDKCSFFTEGFSASNVIHLDAAENILNVLSQDVNSYAIMLRSWQQTSCFPSNVVGIPIIDSSITNLEMNHYLIHIDKKRFSFGERIIYDRIIRSYENHIEQHP